MRQHLYAATDEKIGKKPMVALLASVRRMIYKSEIIMRRHTVLEGLIEIDETCWTHLPGRSPRDERQVWVVGLRSRDQPSQFVVRIVARRDTATFTKLEARSKRQCLLYGRA
jgi:hypothetical protein